MGKIKKILENELTGGNQSTEIYPVTSIKAVYDENNERLDNIIDRKDNEIQKELEAEVARATNAESNLRETINSITKVNENATSANIVTIDTIPNTSSSNVQQALNELYKILEAIDSGGAKLIDIKGEYQNGDCWLYGDLSDYTAGISDYARFHQVDISKYVGQQLDVRCAFLTSHSVGSGIVAENGSILLRFEQNTLNTQTVEIPANSKWLRISNRPSLLSNNDVVMQVKYKEPIELPFKIINDLETGGTDNVLSAEMGKKLGDEVFGGFKDITPTVITEDKAYLDNLTPYNYGGTNCNRFEQIDVSEYAGLKMRIRAFVPSGKQVASGFVNANGGVISKLAFDSDEVQELVIDETAKYLRLCFYASKQNDVFIKVEQKGLIDRISSTDNETPFTPVINMKGIKWKAIGDSITAGTNNGTSYVPLVAELLGIEAINAGFPADTISSMSNRNGYQKTDADIVTMFGGTNDFNLNVPIGEYGSTDDCFYKELELAYNKHVNSNPGVSFYFITPCKRFDKLDTNSAGFVLSDYVDAMLIFCSKKKIPVIDLYYTDIIKNVNYCIGDKLHLSQQGAAAVAKAIAQAINLFEVSRRFLNS